MRLIIICFSLLLLSGCFNHTVKPEIVKVRTEVVCPNLIDPLPITPYPVEFKAIKDINGIYYLGLDGKNYSNLAINSEELLRYITQQKIHINTLEECIVLHNKKGEQ